MLKEIRSVLVRDVNCVVYEARGPDLAGKSCRCEIWRLGEKLTDTKYSPAGKKYPLWRLAFNIELSDEFPDFEIRVAMIDGEDKRPMGALVINCMSWPTDRVVEAKSWVPIDEERKNMCLVGLHVVTETRFDMQGKTFDRNQVRHAILRMPLVCKTKDQKRLDARKKKANIMMAFGNASAMSASLTTLTDGSERRDSFNSAYVNALQKRSESSTSLYSFQSEALARKSREPVSMPRSPSTEMHFGAGRRGSDLRRGKLFEFSASSKIAIAGVGAKAAAKSSAADSPKSGRASPLTSARGTTPPASARRSDSGRRGSTSPGQQKAEGSEESPSVVKKASESEGPPATSTNPVSSGNNSPSAGKKDSLAPTEGMPPRLSKKPTISELKLEHPDGYAVADLTTSGSLYHGVPQTSVGSMYHPASDGSSATLSDDGKDAAASASVSPASGSAAASAPGSRKVSDTPMLRFNDHSMESASTLKYAAGAVPESFLTQSAYGVSMEDLLKQQVSGDAVSAVASRDSYRSSLDSNDMEPLRPASPAASKNLAVVGKSPQSHQSSSEETTSSDGEELAASSSNISSASDARETLSLNERYQRLVEQLDSQEEVLARVTLQMELVEVANAFINTALMYGKIIISEAYLPDEKRTIKPRTSNGRLGGRKYFIRGIIFKFAVDDSGIFGGGEHAKWAAAKVAGHELKG